MPRRKTVSDLLNAARAELQRLTPEEALAAVRDGAVLVDIRFEDERRRQGYLPGAIHHPLSVVLWRLDADQPTHDAKLPLDTRLLLICREGYGSSVVAVQLREIGFQNTTDVIGGVAGVTRRIATRADGDRPGAGSFGDLRAREEPSRVSPSRPG